ncbi:MAG: phenylacetate--CoA ligase family protein [Limisphaerales bacterium]
MSFPTRATISTGQLAQLRRLMAALLPGNAFYRKKFAGIDPCVASLEDFSVRFPFTTKQELVEDQRAAPPFGTNLTFPAKLYTRFHQTSGTTSAPLRWLDHPESWAAMVENWKEIFLAAGIGAEDRVYFAFSFGPFIGFWLAFAAAEQLGCLCLPGGSLSSAGRLHGILENGATVLCCTPSYAVHLAEVAAREGIDLNGCAVRALIVAGEPGGSIPATRRRISELWPKAAVFDHHGMTETGPVSHQCPAEPGTLHILERAFLAEVIDAQGKPAREGEVGELVLTTLERIGSPVLRYRTGDLVRAKPLAQACVCGRQSLALAGGILGRTDEMIIVRGVNIFPTAVEDVLRGFPEVAEYRVDVDGSRSLTEIKLNLEPQADCAEPAELGARVQETLQRVFNLRVPVTLAPAGSLPRFEMKAKRWRLNVAS